MDETKLPKWAQERLDTLRREVASARKDRAGLIGEADPTFCKGFWLEGGLNNVPDYPLPLGIRHLTFRGSTGILSLSREQDKASGKTWLNINAASGGVVVRPRVSNVINIRALSQDELY